MSNSDLLTDPREIRKLFDNLRYSRGWDSHSDQPLNAPLIAHALDTARYLGMSGEDSMTFLAYHALLRLAEFEKRAIEILNATQFKIEKPL